MPETSDQRTKSPRTWRPMAAWTAGMVGVLGLAVFVAMVVAPALEVRGQLKHFAATANQSAEGPVIIERLGGQESAARKLGLHLSLPRFLAGHRSEAVSITGLCGQPGARVLVNILRDPDARMRRDAAQWLGACGHGCPGAVAALAACLGDSDPVVRWCAAGALADLGPEASGSVPVLIAALRDPDPVVRRNSVTALGRMGPASLAAMPELLGLLADPEIKMRISAAVAVNAVSPDNDRTVPVLMAALGNVSPEVQASAAEALSYIRPPVKRAAPVLQKLLLDAKQYPDADHASYYTCEFAEALAKIEPGSKPALQALVSILSSDDLFSSNAAVALGEIGPSAKEAVPALESALRSRDKTVRSAAAEALKKISGEEVKGK